MQNLSTEYRFLEYRWILQGVTTLGTSHDNKPWSASAKAQPSLFRGTAAAIAMATMYRR